MSSDEGVTSKTSPPSPAGVRVLILGGGEPGPFAHSQLLVLQELIHRLEWELNDGTNEVDDMRDPVLSDYFEVISGSGMGGLFAILSSIFNMSVPKMITVTKALCDDLFSLPNWKGPDIKRDENLAVLKRILHEVLADQAEVLDSAFSQRRPEATCHGFLCAADPQNLRYSRVFSTHSSRTRPVSCTVLQALILSICDSIHIPAVELEDTLYIGAAHPWSSPIHATVSQMDLTFRHRPSISSITSIGFSCGQSLTIDQPGQVLLDGEDQVDHLQRQCPENFFFHLGIPLKDVDSNIRHIAAATKAYLSGHICSEIMDEVVASLIGRAEVMPLQKLVSFKESDQFTTKPLAEVIHGLDFMLLDQMVSAGTMIHQLLHKLFQN